MKTGFSIGLGEVEASLELLCCHVGRAGGNAAHSDYCHATCITAYDWPTPNEVVKSTQVFIICLLIILSS